MYTRSVLTALLSYTALASCQSSAIDIGLSPDETSALLAVATNPAALSELSSELATDTTLAQALATEFDNLFTNLPSSVIAAIPTSLDSALHDPAGIESLFSEYQTAYSAGTEPSWFDTLPTAAQSEWESLYGLIAGPEPTASASSGFPSYGSSNGTWNGSSTNTGTGTTVSPATNQTMAAYTGAAAGRPSGAITAGIVGALGVLALAIAL